MLRGHGLLHYHEVQLMVTINLFVILVTISSRLNCKEKPTCSWSQSCCWGPSRWSDCWRCCREKLVPGMRQIKWLLNRCNYNEVFLKNTTTWNLHYVLAIRSDVRQGTFGWRAPWIPKLNLTRATWRKLRLVTSRPNVNVRHIKSCRQRFLSPSTLYVQYSYIMNLLLPVISQPLTALSLDQSKIKSPQFA